ncbi:MAG: hypothetical protein U9N33_04010, partial [Campylobacterota bacterium]|nr:hypothetical protein [Campylobacterota bacterium]
MTALNIDDRHVENIFLDGFNGNKEKFYEFIKESYKNFKPKNTQEDSEWDFDFWGGRTKQEVEDDFDKSLASGLCEQSHDEIWDELIKK